jgi:signal peptidase I
MVFLPGFKKKLLMTHHELLTVILIGLLLVILPSIGLYGMFRKAGVPAWKGLVPYYNFWTMLEIAKRPKYWFLLMLIPVVGWFIALGICVEFVKTFNKFKLYQHALTVFAGMFYFPYIGFNEKDKFVGTDVVKKHKKSGAREWIDAGVFAIVAATLIRTFVFEAYVIPTGSMEKTLLVNDFLFVSKFSYGPRIPNTPLAIPFVHHALPFSNAPSYLEWIKIPYTRWFPSPVKRNDVVVFNFPAGDTIINKDEYQSAHPYYDVARELGNGNIDIGRKVILNDPDQYPLIVYPVDKQENYIKRCVGAPGDTIEIKEDVVYINSLMQEPPPFSQLHYIVTTGGQQLDADVMKEEYDLDADKGEYATEMGNQNLFSMALTPTSKNKMIKAGIIKNIKVDHSYNGGGGSVFPYDDLHKWTRENFGPVWIPKKGSTVTLTPQNFSIYERAIRTYEGNTLEEKNGSYFINNKQTNQYTFKMDYFWMMGDNRQDSQDSRYWGFVPEDHIVGEASLIWMSYDKGLRWSRIFKKIK